MSGITTHVLDTSRGRPAAGVKVMLERQSADQWTLVGSGATDGDGRLRDLTADSALAAGRYRLTFDTGSYFAAAGVESFFPQAVIVFNVLDPTQHFHVPLLLSPFGYSTYRGS